MEVEEGLTKLTSSEIGNVPPVPRVRGAGMSGEGPLVNVSGTSSCTVTKNKTIHSICTDFYKSKQGTCGLYATRSKQSVTGKPTISLASRTAGGSTSPAGGTSAMGTTEITASSFPTSDCTLDGLQRPDVMSPGATDFTPFLPPFVPRVGFVYGDPRTQDGFRIRGTFFSLDTMLDDLGQL